jgi:hypothetical protein
MNTFLALLTSVIFSLNFSSEVPYSSLEKAFKANQSADIVSLGKEMMVINILSNEGVYSSQQATLVLKNFFSKHPGNSFEYTFKGKQTSDGAFAIANYFSKSEKYRVTIHFKKINASYKIESLSIEKD